MEKIIYNFIEFEVIDEFPNYAVSRCGKVLSLNYNRTKNKKLLKYQLDSHGYFYINLTKNKQLSKKWIHRLVAEQFISNSENKPQVNHINGIKTDNKVENLEWNTAKENQQHSWRCLNRQSPMKGKKGVLHHQAKKIDQYTLKGEFIRTWDSLSDIGRELNYSIGNISSCCTGNYKSANGHKWKYHK